jgi:hypothetical protein
LCGSRITTNNEQRYVWHLHKRTAVAAKAFFITNQFVPDRVRAKVEEELSKKHGSAIAGGLSVDLDLHVRPTQLAAQPFEFKIQDHEGRPHVEISSATFHAQKMSHDEQQALKDKLIDLLVHIMTRVFIIDISEEQLRKLIHEELALERSVDFTSSFVTAGNVLGYTPLKKGEGEPPATLWQGSTSHVHMETLSLIRMALWDRAFWAGAAFLWSGNKLAATTLTLPVFLRMTSRSFQKGRRKPRFFQSFGGCKNVGDRPVERAIADLFPSLDCHLWERTSHHHQSLRTLRFTPTAGANRIPGWAVMA